MNTSLNDAQLPPTLPEQAMARRRFLTAAGVGGALLLLPAVPETASASGRVGAPRPGDSVVIDWNAAFLQGARDSKLGPAMVARALAIGHTCATCSTGAAPTTRYAKAHPESRPPCSHNGSTNSNAPASSLARPTLADAVPHSR
jgi:hypothetical protein